MFRSVCFLFIALLAVVDARSSLARSHVKRALSHRHARDLVDSLGGDLGLGAVLSSLGLDGSPTASATSSVLPPTSTDIAASPTSTSCDGLLGLGCSSPSPTADSATSPSSTPTSSDPPADSTSAPAPTSSCDGLLGLGIGCAPSSDSPTSASAPASTPAPTSSCDGLLGLGIGCSASSSLPVSPALVLTSSSQPTAQSTPTPTPTSSCDGLLGLGIGCSASTSLPVALMVPSTLTSSSQSAAQSTPTPTPTSSCDGLLGIGCSASTSLPVSLSISPALVQALSSLPVSLPSSLTQPLSSLPTSLPSSLALVPTSSSLPVSLPSSLAPVPTLSNQPTAQSTPTPAPTSSCDGLLGIGCSASTSLPVALPTSPALVPTSFNQPTVQSTPAPAPTSSCLGFLGLGIGCPAPPSSLPVSLPSSPAFVPTLPSLPTAQPTPTPAPTPPCNGFLGLGIGCPPSPSNPPPSPTVSPTTTPCIGFLGLGFGCPVSSSLPFNQPTQSATPTPAPTNSCSGFLGLGIGCPAPSSTPAPLSALPTSVVPSGASSGTPMPTTSCAIWGIFGCVISTPTATESATLTGPLPTSTVISFTQGGASTNSTVSPSTATSFSPTATGNKPTPTNSNYAYLSTVPSLLLDSVSPTTSYTASNPDQAATTFSLVSAPPTASPSAPPLPSGLPRVILPQPELDPASLPNNNTMINVLFNTSLSWEFVAGNADSPGQIFFYFPNVIATALNINVGDVQNYELIVYEPSSYTGPGDVGELGTIWQGYIPSSEVSPLGSLISDLGSSFYTAQSNSIATSLARCVDPSLKLDAISGPPAGTNSTTGSLSSGSNTRQDAIIGVVSSLGAIAILIVAYVGYKAYQRRRALAHRRLSDEDVNSGVGVRPDGQEFDRDSVGGQRRRSFYYAEDSLRGYQSTQADEEGYDHHVTNMRERRAVQPGTISTPILRESTMNW